MAGKGAHTKYASLTRKELIERLEAKDVERDKVQREDGNERERLLENLRTHQTELEAQNLSLREAHDEVEASRNRYAELYEFAPIAYCTFDVNGVILAINLTGSKLLGRERGQLIGEPFRFVARASNSDAFRNHLAQAIRSVGSVVTELAVETNAGSKELQLVSSAVAAANGETTVRTAYLDVSAQRNAEREARAEKAVRARLDALERASATVNSALAKLSADDVAGFLQVVIDQARVALSAQYGALGIGAEPGGEFKPWIFSGMSRADSDAIGSVPRAIGLLGATLHSGGSLRLRDVREHAASIGFPPHHPAMHSFLSVPIQYQSQRRGHLYFTNKIGALEFTADDQRVAELLADRIGVAMEIARLRSAEAQEHAAADLLAGRLTSAVENSEDALALYDSSQRLVLFNSAYRALFQSELGQSYAKLIDASLAVIHFDSEEERQQFRTARLALPKTHERIDVQLRDGRKLRISNRPTIEGGMVQTVIDLSDEARREHELSQARLLAERASSAKSEFLSSMSHELRTPLNGILGFAQLLINDRKQPLAPRHMERLLHIQHSGEHLLRLIDEVLDLSRIEAGSVAVSLEPVNVFDALQEIETTLATTAVPAQIRIVLPSSEHASPCVLADRVRLLQVLMNFGSNAIKYGRSGGKVELRVSRRDAFVRIGVADDGLGIPANKHADVFTPFQRAGRENGPIEGTGIGLAIAKRLTELMGGRIGFESTEGQGSEFWIELPIDETAHDASHAEPDSGERGERQTLNPAARAYVLYIEDNPLSAALMEDVLSDFQDVELEVAPTAERGLKRIQARRPNVVIMDVNLPGMSGLEAARKLRAAPGTKTLPLVALTAAVMPKDIADIERAGFDKRLTKPVDVDELLQVLEQLLGANAVHS